MVYKFFDRMNYGSGLKNEIILNRWLTEELYKAIIRKFKKKKYLQLISKFKKGIFHYA